METSANQIIVKVQFAETYFLKNKIYIGVLL